MSAVDERPIEIGDRFESQDKRDEGRVVEVLDVVTPSKVDHRGEIFQARTEAHPKNPDAIGNVSRISEKTLRNRRRYRRISR